MKIPANLKSAAKLLLNFIIQKYGGYSEVGRLVGLERQTLHTACTNGAITLTTVHQVAKALGISPWALSYVKLYTVFGKDSADFEGVVNTSSTLSEEDKEKILKVYKKR